MAIVKDESDSNKSTPPFAGTEDDIKPVNTAKRQIRYLDNNDEIQQFGSSYWNNGGNLKRRGSTYSIHSLSSIKSGRRVVDPATALPVLYRTMSIDVSRTQEAKGSTIQKDEFSGKHIAGD
jgi:sodium/potassium-transporting ATPase subunit alpha